MSCTTTAAAAAPTMWDSAVIGLGGVGSFALRSLARLSAASSGGGENRPQRPLRVLGLERFDLCHSRGSSHGGTRIFRHAYFEHPDYVPLLRYSTEEFLKLEEEAAAAAAAAVGEEGAEAGGGAALVEWCGNLIIERVRPATATEDATEADGGAAEAATAETKPGKERADAGGGGATPLIDACLRSARRHSVPVEVVPSAEELRRRFPQLEFHDDHVGLWEPGGGFVRPERAVRAAVDDAVRHGAEVREGVRVLSIEERGDHVVIRTLSSSGEDGVGDGDEGVVLARRVIVAGGPWTSDLVPPWKPYLRVTRQVQAWIDVAHCGAATDVPEEEEDCDVHRPSRMPTWIRAPEPGDPLPPLYGFPADPSSDHPARIKLALHGRDDPVEDPDVASYRRTEVTDSDLKELASAARTFVRAASAVISSSSLSSHPFVDAKTCLYTVTPDNHFLLGRPRGFRFTYAAAGLSGHGFKMVPALGRALADLALEGATELPVEFLSPSRFGV